MLALLNYGEIFDKEKIIKAISNEDELPKYPGGWRILSNSSLSEGEINQLTKSGVDLKEFIKNQDFELIIPKIKTLDSGVLKCRVTRSYFMESAYEYEIGLKFIPPNTDYLKQLVSVLQA